MPASTPSTPFTQVPRSPARVVAALDSVGEMVTGEPSIAASPASTSPSRPPMGQRANSHYLPSNHYNPKGNHRPPPLHRPRSGLASPIKRSPSIVPSTDSGIVTDKGVTLDISDVGLHAGDVAPQGVTPSGSSPSLSTPGLGEEPVSGKTSDAFQWSGSPLSAQKEDIVPWAYMEDNSRGRSNTGGLPTSATAGRVQTPSYEKASQMEQGPRHSSVNISPTRILPALDALPPSPGQLRSISAANGRSSSLTAAGAPTFASAPGSNKKLKNPFSFLRKRSSHLLRDGDIPGYPTSPGYSPGLGFDPQRKASAVSSSSRYSSPPPSASGSRPGSSSQNASVGFPTARGSIESSSASIGANASAATKGRSMVKASDLHAHGIDEEQEFVENASGNTTHGAAKEKKRRLVRPLTREKETRRGGSQDDLMGLIGLNSGSSTISGLQRRSDGATSAANGRGGSKGASVDAVDGPLEVEMKLDMNFDQLDDIVDPSVHSNIAHVGPKDEPLTEDIWGQAQQLSAFTRSGSRGKTNGPTGVSGSAASKTQGDQPTNRGSAPNISLSSGNPTGSGSVGNRSPLNQIEAGKSTLRKISFADVQKLSQWDGHLDSKGRRTSAVSPTSAGDHSPRSPGLFSATPMQTSRWNAVEAGAPGEETTAREHRKASAMSRTSARSGVSPKSSAVNLVLPPSAELSETTAHWSKQGFADPNYEFPPPTGAAAVAGDTDSRKGSAGSIAAAGGASSWAAPDSWAVQPDKADDVNEGDDSSGNDSEEAEQTLRSPQQTRKGSVLSMGWSRHSASSTGGGMSFTRSRDGSSAGPADGENASSTMLNASASGTTGGANGDLTHIKERSSVEVLTPVEDDGQSFSSPTTSSRGGALATAPSSATAATTVSGKLNLNRSSRQKPPVRPSTSGSPGATTSFPSSTRTPATPHHPAEEADASAGPLTPAGTIASAQSKRPALGNQFNHLNSSLSRNYIVRIDTPFGTRTVSIPLFTNASEVRAIIARKAHNLAGGGGFRLFVRDKGSERPLGDSEKPALLQRRRLEQAGFTEADGLETLGREDHSYLLQFVYRPDSVPNFDSESFGNTEDRYQYLDLSGRNIEMVPIFVYRHADWISFLDLSANPMTDLPSDFIQLCTNLHTLRLSSLNLKRVPQSIRTSETLTHLDLANNRIPDLNHIALDQVAQLRSLNIQNNRLADLPPYFSRLKALKQLNLSNNRFEWFPSVICELSSLSDLDISFNSIPALDPQIGSLKHLQSLVLVSNSLEVLPQEISGLSNLRKIDLRRNSIQDVSALFQLHMLAEAQCEHNSIKALDAVLAGNLRSINLGHNPLSKMTIGTSARSHLVSLDLSAANLSRLDDGLVGHLHALRDLNLDNNQFVSLPHTLGQLAELQTLKCTNNNLASLPDSIGSLSNLRLLLVHNNNLKSLPSSIWQCGKLDTINASSNLLESFPLPPVSTEGRNSDPSPKQSEGASNPAAATSSLTAQADVNGSRKGSVSSLGATGTSSSGRKLPPLVSALKKLRLADNRLTHDVLDVLGCFAEVEVLNLSFNEIYEVPPMSLAKLTSLRELYLSGNNLSSLPTDDLVYMKRLRILHLNANRLLTLPAELGQLHDLANLDVGNNSLKYNIANWQFDWNWNSNPELRYLNLSGNKRLEIKSKMAAITGAGRKTDASDFQRLASLRVLSLIDVTVLLQTMPDENDNRRVRTSLSQVNNMSYGMSDALGRFDNLNLVDVVIPQFCKDPRQCVFGLFEGRGHSMQSGSRIAKFLSDSVKSRFEREVKEALAHGGLDGPEEDSILPRREQVSDILRRAFLRLQQEYALLLMSESARKAAEAKASALQDESKASLPAIAASTAKAQWQAGAAGVILYIADRTLYAANAGDALAVLSRGGTAEGITTRHDPLDRSATERIRMAEGWVSLRGYVNDLLEVSRSFGYFHLNPIVTAAPMVRCVELEDSDEFVIVASRALWDHMSFQTAVDIARTEKNDLMIAAQKLRDFAISYGAEESIMVMIVGVGDLFESRQTPGGTLDASMEYFRKSRGRERAADLPEDRTLARLEREVAPPIGQVALVFTDIKNSTSLWETNGGMHSAMRLHNVLLRRQLRTVGGYEVKTEGDAFMVSFPTVTSALLWCFNVQLALLREDWPQEILESEDGKEVLDAAGDVIYRGLSVRMGVHWGRPVCEADPITRRMDYFGPMVNRSARVSGAADGGQIMASRDFINELTDLLSAFDAASDNAAQVELDETDALIVEDAQRIRVLPSNVRRDVVLLRRMGFGISEMGERKLKGFEMAETLNLVYPKALAGRMASREDVAAPQVFEPTLSLLSIDEIKALGMVCLRLEALSNAQIFPGIVVETNTVEPSSAAIPPPSSDTASVASVSTMRPSPPSATALANESSSAIAVTTSLSLLPASSRQRLVEEYLGRRPEILLIAVRDDATDEELAILFQQLVIRTCNALAMILLRIQLCSQPPVSGDDPRSASSSGGGGGGGGSQVPSTNGGAGGNAGPGGVDMQELLALISPFRELF